MGKLDNKTVLITGGTSGMGEAMAYLFADEGADVIIVGRNESRGQAVVDKIISADGHATFFSCDITSKDAVDVLRAQVEQYSKKLDILVNNAGVFIDASIEDMEEDKWMQVFDINMTAPMWVTHAFIDMIVESQGNILFNASIDGLFAVTRGRRNCAYAASKAGVVQFAKQLALNYTPKGIRVNTICPGVTETPFFTNRDFSRFLDRIPMGRVGQPEEIAKAALFLVSDDASFISGACLTVDGAESLM